MYRMSNREDQKVTLPGATPISRALLDDNPVAVFWSEVRTSSNHVCVLNGLVVHNDHYVTTFPRTNYKLIPQQNTNKSNLSILMTRHSM